MTTEERNQLIVDSINAGMSLSDLQKLLAEEYNEKMSYLDLRILSAELAIDWEKRDKPVKKADPKPQPPKTTPEETEAPQNMEENSLQDEPAEELPEQEEETAGDSTPHAIVTIDDTPMPRTAMSGTVTFTSGTSTKWFMDRYGRMGISELPEGAVQPTEEDFQDFQAQLQLAMQEQAKKLQEMAENGNTQVDISPVIKPGCELNGTVTFDSGIKGEWMISQGKVDFQLDDPTQKPSHEEMQAFQYALSKKLREKGYR